MQFYQRMLLIVVACSGLIAAPQAFAYQQITAGSEHTCGLKNDGSAICWGDNTSNQSTVPSGTFIYLSAGGFHTCGLKSDGSATCWGSNDDGQATAPSGTFTQLSAGGFHTCGLKSDGSAVCWGSTAAVPSDMFTQLSAGEYHNCGLKSDGSATCWGSDDNGQSRVPGGTFTQLSAGERHTCGLKSDGSAVCWGSNTFIGTTVGQSTVPTGAGTFTQVSVGAYHTCGLKSDGSAICWGSNGYGQTTVPSGTLTQISAGYAHTCGLKSDGSAVCWGGGTQTDVPVDNSTNSPSLDTTGRIKGISTRAPVGITAEQYMMAGVYVQGTTQKQVLVRATGEGLMKQGVNTTLDANLEVYRLGRINVLVDKNDEWEDHSSYSSVQAVGGASDTLDAALVTNLNSGNYSMVKACSSRAGH